jgi:hypothetical protein
MCLHANKKQSKYSLVVAGHAVGQFLSSPGVWLKHCVLSNCLDLNKSPPVTNAKLKNRRTKYVQKLNKDCQADVGFFSSLTQLHNKILSKCYDLKTV